MLVSQVPGLTPAILKYIDIGKKDFSYQGTDIDLPHLAATLLAHIQFTPFPDFWTGWGGDLATLMHDIIRIREEGSTDSIQKISDRLIGGDSKFSRVDILADIDAVGIANRILSENKTDNFLEVFKNYFQTVTPTSRRKVILKDITGSETILTSQDLSKKIEEKMVGSEGFDYAWGTIGYALLLKARYSTETKEIYPNSEVISAACNSFANYILTKL